MIEDDEKLTSIVFNAKNIKINVNEIKVLYFIHKVGIITQREIERLANLRQPEVSIAIKNLTASGIIDNSSVFNPSKGRPQNCYRLNKPVSEYLLSIKKQKENEWMIITLAIEDMIRQFSD